MKVYLYGDLFVILNLIMNLFLLLVMAMLRQKRCRFFRLFFLSVCNALLSLGSVYLFWGEVLPQFFAAVLQMAEIVFLAFPSEGVWEWVKDFAVFVLLAFVSGGCIGVCQSLLYRMQMPGMAASFAMVIGASGVIFILFLIFRREILQQKRDQKSLLSAVVFQGDIRQEITVLYDTGNQLVSPYSGESVAVISETLAKALAVESKQHPVLIPYHSIGGEGLLKAYRIECIRLEDGRVKKDFLAAVSGQLCAQKRIQMILNITWSK